MFVYVEQSGYVHLASGLYDVAKSCLCQIWHRDDGCLLSPPQRHDHFLSRIEALHQILSTELNSRMERLPIYYTVVDKSLIL